MDLGTERKVTILDEYECVVMPDRLRISINNPRDPSLVDIMSEIHQSNGHIYFDGSYYVYIDQYEIANYEMGWCLDLFVSDD